MSWTPDKLVGTPDAGTDQYINRHGTQTKNSWNGRAEKLSLESDLAGLDPTLA